MSSQSGIAPLLLNLCPLLHEHHFLFFAGIGKLLDTLQNNNRKNALMGDQDRLEATQKEFLLKQQGEEKELEKSKKKYLLKQQEEDAQLGKIQKRIFAQTTKGEHTAGKIKKRFFT